MKAIFNLYEGWKHGVGFWDTAFKVVTAGYVFITNLYVNCSAWQFYYDISSYCFRSDQCDSFDIYLYNITVNAMPILLSVAQIG